MHDILVLRCLCEMDRKDHGNRDVFVVTVAKAFGQSFSKECRDMIFHVHRKVTWGRPRRRSPGPLGHPHLVPRGTSGHERLGALGDTSALRLGTCWIIAGRNGARSILVWMKKKTYSCNSSNHELAQ